MISTNKEDLLAATLCLTSGILVHQFFKVWWKQFATREKKWIPVGVIKKLFVYPLKSGEGLSVFSLLCGPNGPQSGENLDRIFLVTDPDGNFFRARLKPQIMSVKAEIRQKELWLEFKEMKCKVDLSEVTSGNQRPKIINIRGEQFEAFDCGEEVAEFLTKVIGEPAKLMWHRKTLTVEKKTATFSDEYPLMVSSQTSLDDLNRRLVEKNRAEVSNANMRANIVIDKTRPWEEDEWQEIRFGDHPSCAKMTFACIEPCIRCLMTTIDIAEAKLDPSQEPLITLKEIAKELNVTSPIFGVYGKANEQGFIHVGSTVWARYKDK